MPVLMDVVRDLLATHIFLNQSEAMVQVHRAQLLAGAPIVDLAKLFPYDSIAEAQLFSHDDHLSYGELGMLGSRLAALSVRDDLSTFHAAISDDGVERMAFAHSTAPTDHHNTPDDVVILGMVGSKATPDGTLYGHDELLVIALADVDGTCDWVLRARLFNDESEAANPTLLPEMRSCLRRIADIVSRRGEGIGPGLAPAEWETIEVVYDDDLPERFT